MRTVIYYRGRDFERDELSIAEKYFTCINSILDLQKDDLVIGRFSLWPFYGDQERDIKRIGATLINSLRQHSYIADLQNYVADLKEMTPETWHRLQDLPDEGPFIVKGATNSRKFEWNTMMFAKTKQEASVIQSRLLEDSMIGRQEIYFRRYVPLKTYTVGLRGLPITKEFRFFVAYGKVLSGGYYWSSHLDELTTVPSPDEVPRDFLEEAIARIGTNASFYTLDVAQTETGNWIVIELNDGQQAGTSENDLDTLYRELAKVCDETRRGV